MGPLAWKDLFTAIKDALLAIGVLVGGGWALWRFVLEREGKPKIQFDLDLNILGKQGNKFLVEVIAIVENKGRVRHWLKDFRFDLHYFPRETGTLIRRILSRG